MPETTKKGGTLMEETTPNRSRSRQVKFWVNEEEYELLQKKMEAAGGVNQGAYIRKMILDGYIVNLDIPELKEIIRLLGPIGNNVNQMARKVNAGSSIYKEDIEEINTKLEQVYKMLIRVMGGLGKIR